MIKLGPLHGLFNAIDQFGQILLMVGLALVTAMLFMFATDRQAPFEVIGYHTNSPTPGSQLRVNAVVRRDVKRECSVKFSRALYDSNGVRYWATAPEYVNSAGLSDLQRISPDELKMLVDIPYWAPVGKTELVSNLDYICNPLHYIWPIEVVMRIETEVKAP